MNIYSNDYKHWQTVYIRFISKTNANCSQSRKAHHCTAFNRHPKNIPNAQNKIWKQSRDTNSFIKKDLNNFIVVQTQQKQTLFFSIVKDIELPFLLFVHWGAQCGEPEPGWASWDDKNRWCPLDTPACLHRAPSDLWASSLQSAPPHPVYSPDKLIGKGGTTELTQREKY